MLSLLLSQLINDFPFISAGICPHLLSTPHQIIKGEELRLGAIVHVTCELGYHFEDRNRSKVLKCEEENKWNDTIQACIGK